MTLVNTITSLRIVGTFLMLFTVPLSKTFFIIYTLSGFTDVLDGFIARKTNSVTEFGAKLDSVADLLLYGIMVYKLFPVLWGILPVWIWCATGFVIIIRALSYIITALKFRKFMSNHTYLNKLTGFCAFLLPYAVTVEKIAVGFCSLTCVVVVLSAITEFYDILKEKSNK